MNCTNTLSKILDSMPIKGEKTCILPLSFDDIKWYVAMLRDKNLTRYQDTSLSDDISDLLAYKSMLFQIVKRNENTFILNEIRCIIWDTNLNNKLGNIMISLSDDNYIELGYWILQDQQSKGIMTDALRQVQSTLMGLNITIAGIKLVINENNIASINLAHKLGFQLEAINKSSAGSHNNMTFIHKIR